MNYLQQLLKDQKVEWKKLGEVAEFQRGRTITKKDSQEGVFPVISGGQKPAYYIDQFNSEGQTITIAGSGAYAGFVQYWEGPIFVSDAFSIKANEDVVLAKYIYHFLLNIQDRLYQLKRGAGVPHVYAKDVATIEIPLPPLSVQSRIVEILDKFTALEAELEQQLQAELELRKKQYQHYREQLLNFSSTPPHEFNVIWRKLGEVCDVLRGRRLTKKQLSQDKGGFAVFHGGIVPIGYYPTANRKANSTMVINVGASAGTVGFSREKFWSSDGCFCFTENSILLQRFLFYYLQSIEHEIKSKVRVAGIPTLDAGILSNLEIPLPPLSVQSRIVEILDKFDALTNSITEGLPLEIKLRKQQYEYYREQLLDFRN